MKKTHTIITAAVIALSAAFGTAAAAEERSLAVLGDSITTGYGLEGYISGDNASAADSFANTLALSYSEYGNFAVDGKTTSGLLQQLEDENVSAALAGADTVIVSIGGNDFLQPMMNAMLNAVSDSKEISDLISGFGGSDTEMSAADILSGTDIDISDYMDIMTELTQTILEAANAVDTEEVVSNIDRILSQISDSAPNAQVIILTVYDPFEGVTGMEMFDVVAREKLSALNSGITQAAQNHNAEVADVFTAFKGHALDYTNISNMDIHPNKSGHAVIFSLLSDITGTSVPTAAEASAPNSSAKGSPDTGAEGIAVFAGTAAAAAAAALLSRKRR